MSLKQNDIYFESLQEDLEDAKVVLEQAQKEIKDAYEWAKTREDKVEELTKRIKEYENN